MALGRKKTGGRKEPKFAGKASLDDVRMDRRDRVGGSVDDERSARRSTREDIDDGRPRERKPRKTRAQARKEKKKSRERSRSGIGRLIY